MTKNTANGSAILTGMAMFSCRQREASGRDASICRERRRFALKSLKN